MCFAVGVHLGTKRYILLWFSIVKTQLFSIIIIIIISFLSSTSEGVVVG